MKTFTFFSEIKDEGLLYFESEGCFQKALRAICTKLFHKYV